MTASQARKDAAEAARQSGRCARCRRKLRRGGRHVSGTGVCCERCAPGQTSQEQG